MSVDQGIEASTAEFSTRRNGYARFSTLLTWGSNGADVKLATDTVALTSAQPETVAKSGMASTAIGLIGFVMSLSPFACDLMGWRGAGGLGAASIPVYFFMGGALMMLSGILEWVAGRAFTFVVFATYGGFWLSFAGILVPSFGAYAAYAPAGANDPATGLQSSAFQASIGFWLLFMGLISLLFTICATRINAVFLVLFMAISVAFLLLTGFFWATAADPIGNATVAHRCEVGAGASAFVSALSGWYLLVMSVLQTVDFPVKALSGRLVGTISAPKEKAELRNIDQGNVSDQV